MESADLPEPIRARFENYRPSAATNHEWSVWGEDIRDVVLVARPQTEDEAARNLSHVTSFALSLSHWGHVPPLAPFFTVANTERHCAAIANVGTRRTVRAALTRLGRAVNPTEIWPTQRSPVGKSQRQLPYTTEEQHSLCRAALDQAPEYREQLFQVTLSLGLGAGLDARALPHVLPSHLQVTQSGVLLLNFQELPTIAIHGQFGDWLKHWRRQVADGQPIIGPPSRVNSYMSQLRGDDQRLRVMPARLRTTYVVHLINQRLPVQTLLRLANLSTAGSLDAYLVHAEPDRGDDNASITVPPVNEAFG